MPPDLRHCWIYTSLTFLPCCELFTRPCQILPFPRPCLIAKNFVNLTIEFIRVSPSCPAESFSRDLAGSSLFPRPRLATKIIGCFTAGDFHESSPGHVFPRPCLVTKKYWISRCRTYRRLTLPSLRKLSTSLDSIPFSNTKTHNEPYTSLTFFPCWGFSQVLAMYHLFPRRCLEQSTLILTV